MDELVARKGMGLRPDSQDRRDRALYAVVPDIDALPPTASCERLLPPPTDQEFVGACTGYSGAVTLYCVMKKDGHARPGLPSPVWLYREARVLGGYVDEDAGAEIRNVWKAANRLGMPSISKLKPRFGPADAPGPDGIFPEKSIWRRQPPPGTVTAAEKRQVLSYHRLSTLNDVLQCLADGWPAQIGIPVYRSFFGPGGPRLHIPNPMPGEANLGGHAIVAFAYDKGPKRVTCRNSWGPTPHEGGPDFTLSFDYVEIYAGDMWTGRFVEGGKPI